MKWLVIIGGIVFGGLAVLLSGLVEQLFLFFIAGMVPFTNLVVPPLVMLFFWILVVPVTLLLYRLFHKSFWQTVDLLAARMQRRINRRLRPARAASSSADLYVIALLKLAESLPKSTANLPELSFRRRFLALPQVSSAS